MSTAFMTDKYEITMLQAALESGTAHKPAVFELFARKLPSGRRYGIVGGIDRAVEAVENFVFSDEQLAYLENDPLIKPQTVEFLRNYRFTGTITGYAEGDVYFPYSPILTVEASFADAVLLETVLLSILNHDSAIASAASRMVNASEGNMRLIEMGSRRTHEEAAVATGRLACGVGFDATSNLEAGLRYGVPTTGTSAHAFTLAHPTEREAFVNQVKALGVSTTLLVDTYDIEEGIRTAVDVAGEELGGIRIDSGDLVEEAFKARKLLDELGAVNTKIVLSSDIDEYSIARIVEAKAPVDGIGAGTRVATGSGHPTAGMVYKLVEIDGRPVAKKANGKISIGGKKTAWRTFDTDGFLTGEYFTTDEAPAEAIVTQKVHVQGEEYFRTSFEQMGRNHKAAMAALPASVKATTAGEAYIQAESVDLAR